MASIFLNSFDRKLVSLLGRTLSVNPVYTLLQHVPECCRGQLLIYLLEIQHSETLFQYDLYERRVYVLAAKGRLKLSC